MPTVAGGLFHPVAAATHVAAGARPDAGPLALSSITEAHTTLSGGADTMPAGATGASGAGGGSATVGSGVDTVSGLQGDARFSGAAPTGTEQVVATQTQDGGNAILHLPDGSTITLIGVTHVDASFIH
jgi:hypothetical protein